MVKISHKAKPYNQRYRLQPFQRVGALVQRPWKFNRCSSADKPAIWQTKHVFRMIVGVSPSTETACSRLLLAGTQLTTAECAAISVILRPLGVSDSSAHNRW